jgi:hypothetical protein
MDKNDIPKIGNEIESENLCKAFVVRPCSEGSQRDQVAKIGQNNLIVLMGSKQDGSRLEVFAHVEMDKKSRYEKLLTIRALGIPHLTRSIPGKVGKPAS